MGVPALDDTNMVGVCTRYATQAENSTKLIDMMVRWIRWLRKDNTQALVSKHFLLLPSTHPTLFRSITTFNSNTALV